MPDEHPPHAISRKNRFLNSSFNYINEKMIENTEAEAEQFIAEGKKTGRLVPACNYLELRLPQVEREGVTPYLTGLRHTPEDLKALDAFMKNNGESNSRKFMPYCGKTGEVCVVIESPVMSMQMFGDLYQPLAVTLSNSGRIETCEDRKIPSNALSGTRTLDSFVTYGIARDIARVAKKIKMKGY